MSSSYHVFRFHNSTLHSSCRNKDKCHATLSPAGDLTGQLRCLNYTKIELAFMRQACNGMAEDCRNILYDVFIDKTLALLDAEAEILKEMLRHGTVSAGFHAEAVRGSGSKSSVTLTWNGTDSDLIELVAALMAAGAIGTTEGRDLKIWMLSAFSRKCSI